MGHWGEATKVPCSDFFTACICHLCRNLNQKVILKTALSKMVTPFFLPDYEVREDVDRAAAPAHPKRHPLREAAEAVQQALARRQR